MSLKISQMPLAKELNDSALVPIVEDNTNKVATIAQIANKIKGQEPNMVGKFANDSTPADWFWYPNGEKVAIPVNPVTGEFSYYFDGEISERLPFNPNYVINAGDVLTKLERWDVMPPLKGGVPYRFNHLFNCQTFPVIDAKNLNDLSYLFVNNSEMFKPSRIHFVNTANIKYCEMIFNLPKVHNLIVVSGIDLTNCVAFKSLPLGQFSAPYIEIKNLGTMQTLGTNDANNDYRIDCRAKNWGDDLLANGAKQSLVDSLLTNSFDRAKAGYSYATIMLYRVQYNRLTADEVKAIQAKGYGFEIDETY